MARSVRRLLGTATVAAGVTAAGYVGLVTGACPLDLGIVRRARPPAMGADGRDLAGGGQGRGRAARGGLRGPPKLP